MKKSYKSRWSGPTVRALKRIFGCKSPVDFFVEKAREIIRETGINGPPFNPREYANALGIRVEEREDMTIDGILKCIDQEKFVIYVKKHSNPYRKNFTIAHEIAHTFFYYDLLDFPEKFRGNATFQEYDQEEERLCDFAAAELLMPFSIFKNDLLGFQDDNCITPLTLLKLKGQYQVSLTAIAKRAVWVMQNLACALWTPQRHGITLEWITPSSLKPLILCQTGKSSVERALRQTGEVVTSRDLFYYVQGQRRTISRQTSSFMFRSGQIFSVIYLAKTFKDSIISP